MSDVFDHIDRYLDGDLTPEELLVFNQELQSNADLQEQVKLEKDMRALLSDDDWVETNRVLIHNSDEGKKLKRYYESDEAQSIQNTIREVIEKNRTGGKRKFIWLSIAASIAVLLTSTFLIFKDGSTSDLYAAYIDKEELPSMITRSNGEGVLEKAQLLYEEGNYKKAIEGFENYQAQKDSLNPLSYIYLGISYLEEAEYRRAKAQFMRLSESNTLQSEKADWYLLLTYLKQGNKKEAKQTLNKILQSERSYNYHKALLIREELE